MRVVIFDDFSTDPVTIGVLKKYRNRFEVIGSSEGDDREQKTGGLHANMNRALQYAVKHGWEYLWFVQDDMQIVRKVDESVEQEYSRIFAADEGIAQIRCVFMKSPVVSPDHTVESWVPGGTGVHYERIHGARGILDTGIVSIPRLVEAGFRFVPGERNNSQRGCAVGIRSVIPKNPLYMWLPWPPTAISRLPPVKRAINRFTDRIFRVGYHPFEDMSLADVTAMTSRPADELPYAERFLRLDGEQRVPRPWHYEHSYTYVPALLRELKQGRWPWRDSR